MMGWGGNRRTVVGITCALALLGVSTSAAGSETQVLDWKKCVREAIQNNPALAASAQKIQQSKAQQWVAASPALPQISTQLNLNKSDNYSGGANRNTNTYSIQGEQLIFDGFKTFSDVRAAKQDVISSEYGYVADSSTIRYNLRLAYTELLRAQALVPISEGIIVRRKQNLEMIKLRYESGREHQGSLLLAEADLAQAEFDLKKARRDISVAQYALRKEMGWQKDVPIRVSGNFTIETARDDKPSFAEIAQEHPLVRKTVADKESAKYGVASAKGAFFPELSFTGETGKVRTGGFTAGDKGWTVGLNLALPVFEGGRRIADTEHAVAKLMQATSDERSQYDDVVSTLESAWQTMQDAIDDVEVQRKYLKAAEVRAIISRSEYANGLLIFDNWIIIEDNFVRAQKTFVNAEAVMLLAEAEWIRARGGNLEYQ